MSRSPNHSACAEAAAVAAPLLSLREGESGGAEECRTPTSEESKLPSVPLICPPAPRKQRRSVGCRRRRRRPWLDRVEFIDVGEAELEQLFRLCGDETPQRHAKKRRRQESNEDE